MPTPDPNENNRLPDKIPNIPTPQEKWFKWLWEKREMRFEYRPLEFIRAYADKYLEGDAKFSNHIYTYNKMNLSKTILIAVIASNVYTPIAQNSAAPAADISAPRADLTPELAAAPSCVIDATTKSDVASSDPKPDVIQNDLGSRSGSPESTNAGSVRSSNISIGEAWIADTDLQYDRNAEGAAYKILLEYVSPKKNSSQRCTWHREEPIIRLYDNDRNASNSQSVSWLERLTKSGCQVAYTYDFTNNTGLGIILLPDNTTWYFMIGYVSDCTAYDQLKSACLNNTSLPEGYQWMPTTSSETAKRPTIASLSAELAAANDINKAQAAKLAAQAKEIAAQADEIKRLTTDNNALKQKQQRCTCGGAK